MARQRMLHPGFFTDAKLLRLSPLHRLLFEGLWCLADREGRLKDEPDDIKLAVLPGDACDVDAMLDDLAAVGRVVRYEVDGHRFLAVPHFPDYQHPHHREPASRIPPPPGQAPGKPPAGPGPAPGQPEASPGKARPSRAESESESVTESVEKHAGGLPAAPPPPDTPADSRAFSPPEAVQQTLGLSGDIGAPGALFPLKAPPGPLLQDESPPAKRKAPKPKPEPGWRELVDALGVMFREVRGADYRFLDGKDGAALKSLRRHASDEDILRRWHHGLVLGDTWPGVSTVAQLAQRWNDLAPSPRARARAPPPTQTCADCGAPTTVQCEGKWLCYACMPPIGAADGEAA